MLTLKVLDDELYLKLKFCCLNQTTYTVVAN
jgi:hypothetical protein